MKKVLFLFLSAILLLSSCSRNPKEYRMPEFRTEKDATVEHISKPLEIMNPHRIYEYEDKIILIAYVGKGEDTFYLYDKATGNQIFSGIKFGNGPGEVNGGLYNVSFDSGVLSYSDIQVGERLSFNVSDFLSRGYEAISVEYFEVVPWTIAADMAGGKQFYFGDKTFLKKDSLVVPRIRMVDGKGDTYSYTEETIDDDAIRFFTYMQPYRATSPDGSKLAVASGRGAILETFSIESGIENIQTRYFIRPGIEIKDMSYSFTDAEVWGFGGLSATDKWVFSIIDLKHRCIDKSVQLIFNDIAKFDWSGKPLAIYHTPYQINCFCVDSEGDLVYAVTQDSEGCYYLSKISL